MILIIPDVHEQIVKLKRILKKYGKEASHVVFLGDFMDTFDGLTWQTFETVRWLAENVSNPNYTFIWGNHDMHYAFPIDGVMCSGFDPNKLKIVQEHLTPKHWEKFKLMHWIGEKTTDGNLENPPKVWFCAHAGLHPYLLHPVLGFDREALAAIEERTMYQLRYCHTVLPVIRAGRGRGGPALVGGVDWLDWNTEFIPITGLNQIVGHSPDKTVRIKNGNDSINYCLDTHLKHVIQLDDDGGVKVIKLGTLNA